MCPACIASAALVVGTVTTTGGIAALVARIVGKKSAKTDVSNHLTEGRK